QLGLSVPDIQPLVLPMLRAIRYSTPPSLL
ncbi:MAG: hypothetical protein JWN45_2851, partial [Acidobacteriaceae bacterium]|nr:hypothetical protein [Acidobacteriaceae bacterium]